MHCEGRQEKAGDALGEVHALERSARLRRLLRVTWPPRGDVDEDGQLTTKAREEITGTVRREEWTDGLAVLQVRGPRGSISPTAVRRRGEARAVRRPARPRRPATTSPMWWWRAARLATGTLALLIAPTPPVATRRGRRA